MFEQRAKKMRRRFTIAAIFTAIGALASVVANEACSSSSGNQNVNTPDATSTTDASASSACPETAPDAGAICELPEGTTCAFGQCAGIYFTCTRSAWTEAPITPVSSGCPQTMPEAGASCPACFNAQTTCLYDPKGLLLQQGCTSDTDATSAECAPFSTWFLAGVQCVVEAGAEDAGTDADDDEAGDAADASDAHD